MSANLKMQIHAHVGKELVRRKWRLIRYFIAIGHALGVTSAISAGIILLGYSLGIEALYRPIPQGSATHPVTALVIFCLGLHFSRKHGRDTLPLLLPIFALAMCVLRLAEFYLSAGFLAQITPFQAVIIADHLQGKENAMGINTCLMLSALSLSAITKWKGQVLLSQALSFFALGFPILAITGLAYGIDAFSGDMSLLTTTFGFCLSISCMSTSARNGAIRALLSPYIGGRIARLQALISYGVSFVVGLLFIQTVVNSESENAIGLFVVIVCWFSILLVTVFAIYQEKEDEKRRTAERELMNAATLDPLTELPNRRKFLDAAKIEVARAMRHDRQLWLLMLDIDFFKRINDVAGHAVGDSAIQNVAAILRQSARQTDCVCRLGGEEFAILLTDTDASGAWQVAERIRQQVEVTVLKGYKPAAGAAMTVSIGIACSGNEPDISQLLKQADEHLYQAKAAGRNCIVQPKEQEPVVEGGDNIYAYKRKAIHLE